MKSVISMFVLCCVPFFVGCASTPAKETERTPAATHVFASGKSRLAASVASADFNGDSHVDLVVVTGGSDVGFSSGAVRLFKGLGQGKFSPQFVAVDELDAPETGGGVSVTTNDFNKDGCADFAVAAVTQYFSAKGSISIYLGNCRGEFAKSTVGE